MYIVEVRFAYGGDVGIPGGSLSIQICLYKMRGLFNKIYFNAASRLLKVFYSKFSIHKVIVSVRLVYIFSVYLSM